MSFPYKAVLFDLDDTLYSRVEAAKRTFPGMFKTLLYPNQTDEFISAAVDYMMTKVKRDSMIHIESFEALVSAYPPDISFDHSLCVEYYYRHLPDFAVPFADTERVLKDLRDRGVAIGIVTNVLAERCDSQWRKINNMNLAPLVDTILLSGEVGITKPDPKIFHLAADRLGVSAGDCLFVGDDPNSDIGGALSAGMDAVWVDIYQNSGLYDDDSRVTRVMSLSDYFK